MAVQHPSTRLSSRSWPGETMFDFALPPIDCSGPSSSSPPWSSSFSSSTSPSDTLGKRWEIPEAKRAELQSRISPYLRLGYDRTKNVRKPYAGRASILRGNNSNGCSTASIGSGAPSGTVGVEQPVQYVTDAETLPQDSHNKSYYHLGVSPRHHDLGHYAHHTHHHDSYARQHDNNNDNNAKSEGPGSNAGFTNVTFSTIQAHPWLRSEPGPLSSPTQHHHQQQQQEHQPMQPSHHYHHSRQQHEQTQGAPQQTAPHLHSDLQSRPQQQQQIQRQQTPQQHQHSHAHHQHSYPPYFSTDPSSIMNFHRRPEEHQFSWPPSEGFAQTWKQGQDARWFPLTSPSSDLDQLILSPLSDISRDSPSSVDDVAPTIPSSIPLPAYHERPQDLVGVMLSPPSSPGRMTANAGASEESSEEDDKDENSDSDMSPTTPSYVAPFYSSPTSPSYEFSKLTMNRQDSLRISPDCEQQGRKKAFSHELNLELHIRRVHEGDKPFEYHRENRTHFHNSTDLELKPFPRSEKRDKHQQRDCRMSCIHEKSTTTLCPASPSFVSSPTSPTVQCSQLTMSPQDSISQGLGEVSGTSGSSSNNSSKRPCGPSPNSRPRKQSKPMLPGTAETWSSSSSFSSPSPSSPTGRKGGRPRLNRTSSDPKADKFLCNECERHGSKKGFTRQYNLDTHIRRVHDGDKPFECPRESCGTKFASKGDMDRHYRTHFRNSTDPKYKPHKCAHEGCEERFPRSEKRDKHQQTCKMPCIPKNCKHIH